MVLMMMMRRMVIAIISTQFSSDSSGARNRKEGGIGAPIRDATAYINIQILESQVSGTSLVSGLSARMQDPHVYVLPGASTVPMSIMTVEGAAQGPGS